MAKKTENTMKRVAVIDGCRVPFQRSGTGFYDLMAWQLGSFALKGLLVRTGLAPEGDDPGPGPAHGAQMPGYYPQKSPAGITIQVTMRRHHDKDHILYFERG